MKKSFLLFASVLSLALVVPSGVYAAVSISDLSDADQGKTVDVSGYFVNTFLSDDYDCMSGR
ncbi:MAG TPA: hypothetical protein PK765_06805 [bacterium]|nr:hypothetical protein [bacterium]